MKHMSEYPAVYVSALFDFDERLYHSAFDWKYAAKILKHKGLIETFETPSHEGRKTLWIREKVRLTKEVTLTALLGEMSHEKNLYYRIFRRIRSALFGCNFS